MKWTVILHRERDGGYWVECPALPGCVSQGDTRREALANIREAIEGVLIVMNDVPRPRSKSASLARVEAAPRPLTARDRARQKRALAKLKKSLDEESGPASRPGGRDWQRRVHANMRRSGDFDRL